MDNINAYKAIGFRDEPIQSITLCIDMEIPEAGTLDQQRLLYQREAESIMLVLERLPGGTFDALLGLMHAKKASLFRVKL